MNMSNSQECLDAINHFLDIQKERPLTPNEELEYDFADKFYSLLSTRKLLLANGVKDYENNFIYKQKLKQCVDAKIKLDNYKE